MSWLQAVTLRSPLVTLAPLDPGHSEALIEAVEDGELFKLWYTAIPSPETMHLLIERRLNQQAGAVLPFAIIDNATGKAVGPPRHLGIVLRCSRGPWNGCRCEPPVIGTSRALKQPIRVSWGGRDSPKRIIPQALRIALAVRSDPQQALGNP